LLIAHNYITQRSVCSRTHSVGKKTAWIRVAVVAGTADSELLVLDDTDQAIQHREFDLQLDAVYGRFVRRLDLEIPRVLGAEECGVEDQNQDIDQDEMGE
jgi:hypothetical protein